MKILSRDFTTKEKILILVLVIVLLVLGYFKFVYQPIITSTQEKRAEAENLQTELDIVDVQVISQTAKQNEVEAITSGDHVSIMASYNNVQNEVNLLNSILSGTENYNIAFQDLTREGDQIRRTFSLQFTAGDYAAAEKVIKALYNSEYRCLINDVRTTAKAASSSQTTETATLNRDQVTVTLNATFYETMVGGREDSGLPEDSLAAAAEEAAAEAADEEELSY